MSLKHMRYLLMGLLVSACFAAKPNQWNGLSLNETTPEQAIKTLGAPQRDESGELWNLARSKAFNISSMFFLMSRKTDVVRVLKYEALESFKTVSLIFKGDKLVVIHLEPTKENKIPAGDIKGLYEECVFRPLFQNNEFWNQQYIVNQGTATLRPKNYPVVYRLVGVSVKLDGIVVGTVENVPSFGRAFTQGMGVPDVETPGKIYTIDLVSPVMLPPKPKNKSLE